MTDTAPTRSSTLASTGSDSAIPPETGDVGRLLVERLRAWKHAVGYLEAYIHQTESLHKVLSKEYHKVLKTIDEPLREGHQFHQSVGGVATFFENIRANTARLSTAQTETAAELKNHVLPTLERLHKEIKDRAKHVQSECEKSSKAVQKTRNATQAHIELLGQNSSAFDSVGGNSATSHGKLPHLHTHTGSGKPKPEHDPYLLKKGILQRLAKQVAEENAQMQELLGVQNHTQQFEGHILRTIQEALAAFYQTMAASTDMQKQLYGDVLEKGNAIPPDFEWINFINRNADVLIDPSAPKRMVDSVRFANEDHASTKPLMEGPLSRKGKIMRSYNSSYYVCTPKKYLHEFKDTDHLNKSSEPEMSLYLPDCTLGALSKEGKFQISGKDASSTLKGLSTKHDFAFKASSYDDAVKWHDVISQCAGLTTTEAPIMSPTSPVQPPAYERHDSQNSAQETGTVASPTVVAGST